ncbi:metal ABC transporter permease, partial [Paenibacillus sp. TAF43_2]
IAVVLGLLIAGVWNLAPGGTIVLLLIAVLLLLLVFRRGMRPGS